MSDTQERDLVDHIFDRVRELPPEQRAAAVGGAVLAATAVGELQGVDDINSRLLDFYLDEEGGNNVAEAFEAARAEILAGKELNAETALRLLGKLVDAGRYELYIRLCKGLKMAPNEDDLIAMGLKQMGGTEDLPPLYPSQLMTILYLEGFRRAVEVLEVTFHQRMSQVKEHVYYGGA